MVIFQCSLFNENNVFTYIWMKLPDCAFNIDVKSAFTFWDPIFLLGVTACQRGAEIKKRPVLPILIKHILSIFIRNLRKFNDRGPEKKLTIMSIYGLFLKNADHPTAALWILLPLIHKSKLLKYSLYGLEFLSIVHVSLSSFPSYHVMFDFIILFLAFFFSLHVFYIYIIWMGVLLRKL